MTRASTRRDPEVVSRSMRAVRSCSTAVERSICLELRRAGYKFRSNATNLPGKPDIVFPRKRLVVFVDGDFWHGRQWKLRGFGSLERQFRFVNNRDYWIAKIRSKFSCKKGLTDSSCLMRQSPALSPSQPLGCRSRYSKLAKSLTRKPS